MERIKRFYIHCSCGDEFDKSGDFVNHRASGRKQCSESPLFMVTSKGSINPFSENLISGDRKLAAFFGDLDHKRELALRYGCVDALVSSFFDGKHMAWYLKKFCPDLIDDSAGGPKPSVKTLATIFEYHFHVSVLFRIRYMRWLPCKLAEAPKIEPDGTLPVEAGSVNGVSDFRCLDDLAEPPVVETQSSGFMLPIRQTNPPATVPPGDPNVIFDWANSEKYWRAYPELMGYNRQAAFRTSGDYHPWFLSSVARYDGFGSLHIVFPSVRSPFDGEENNPSLGQLDGLSHWQNEPHVVGFRVAAWALSDLVNFTEVEYNGPRATFEVPKHEAFGGGLYVNFKGTPRRRAYFVIQRFVIWDDRKLDDGPRPDSPGPGQHDDL